MMCMGGSSSAWEVLSIAVMVTGVAVAGEARKWPSNKKIVSKAAPNATLSAVSTMVSVERRRSLSGRQRGGFGLYSRTSLGSDGAPSRASRSSAVTSGFPVSARRPDKLARRCSSHGAAPGASIDAGGAERRGQLHPARSSQVQTERADVCGLPFMLFTAGQRLVGCSEDAVNKGADCDPRFAQELVIPEEIQNRVSELVHHGLNRERSIHEIEACAISSGQAVDLAQPPREDNYREIVPVLLRKPTLTDAERETSRYRTAPAHSEFTSGNLDVSSHDHIRQHPDHRRAGGFFSGSSGASGCRAASRPRNCSAVRPISCAIFRRSVGEMS